MKTWMLPPPLPVGLLGAVVVGWLLVPVLWRVRFPSSDDDADTKHWRIGRR
jgi:uncharacterized integral membrane protein